MSCIRKFYFSIGTYTYTYMFKVIGGISSTFISELQQTDIISSIGMILGLIVIDILMLATKSKMKLSDILLFFGLYLWQFWQGEIKHFYI